MVTACEGLARAAETAGAATSEPHGFLVRLGRDVAGISSGPHAVLDLLRAGRTRIRGGGFRPELADHSGGQTRHFAGTARAVTVLGPRATVWVSEHLRRDAPESADGRLTLLAVEFATVVLDGTLAPADTGEWIRARLCAPRAE